MQVQVGHRRIHLCVLQVLIIVCLRNNTPNRVSPGSLLDAAAYIYKQKAARCGVFHRPKLSSWCLTCWLRRPVAAGDPSRGLPAVLPQEETMLLGAKPAAPIPEFAPIMPQWARSGRCFLHTASVNEFRLSCLPAVSGREKPQGSMAGQSVLSYSYTLITYRSSICAAKASSAARLS